MLAPQVGEALLEDESVVSLMQHPKLAAAVQRLKEQPGAYAEMVANDAELGQLFEALNRAMTAKEAELCAAEEAPPPLKEEDAAEADACRAEGAAAFAAGDYGRACDAYGRAAALRPDDWIHWSNLAAARLRRGEARGAEEAARKCVALNPRFAKGHLRLGEALAARGAYDEAISSFEAGLLRAEGGVRLALTKGLTAARERRGGAAKAEPSGGRRPPSVEEERLARAEAEAMREAQADAMARYAEEAKRQTASAARRQAAAANGAEAGAPASGRDGFRQVQVVEDSSDEEAEEAEAEGTASMQPEGGGLRGADPAARPPDAGASSSADLCPASEVGNPSRETEGEEAKPAQTSSSTAASLLLSNDLIFDLA
ncbi:hypothetical protein AB1Y20_005163 [Prymnesium parvum]|uniref:Uncharacterized protein n=1 Tax=Prymnesium parvum TaxID=97485 RepID=A0AB34J5S7_PRYPA